MTSYTKNDGHGPIKYPIVGQKHKDGSVPTIGPTTMMATRISAPLPVIYDNLLDAFRVNYLYKSLKEAVILCVKSLVDNYFLQAMPFLDIRLSNNTAFRTFSLETVNIVTEDRCFWKSGNYTVANPKGGVRSEKRLRLETVNGIPSTEFEFFELKHVVGDMFTDQCEIGIDSVPKCIYKLQNRQTNFSPPAKKFNLIDID